MPVNLMTPGGFLLNLQLIYEKLNARNIHTIIHCDNNDACLTGVQFYVGQSELSHSFLYIASEEVLEKHPFLLKDGYLIILGNIDKGCISSTCSYLNIIGNCDTAILFNELQQIFSYYTLLERKLNTILNHDGSLHDISALAMEHFHNPVFIHDEYFHILACPQFFEGATNFTYNEQTKRYMQDINTINLFRTSPAYRKTLPTVGGQFWNSDFNNDRCIYANLWIEGSYRGRFVISETQAPLTEGQLSEATYFAEIITLALQSRNLPGEDERHPLEKLIIDAVNQKEPDRMEANRKLSLLEWKISDQYLCGVLSFENSDVTKLSVYSICNDIEERISSCHACYHKGHIYLLANMTKSGITLSDLRMKMSYIIREGLLHMGVSFPFYGFHEFPIHLKQAEIALRYSKTEKVPSWYNEFRSYVLKYWMMEGPGEFTPESIAPGALYQLKDYDKKHNTELYLTLKTYLVHERNSTMTAQILKINRSTLPYRLERISKLTGINTDDFETRLYLLMGFYMLDSL